MNRSSFAVRVHTRYHVESYDKRGVLKWIEDFDNLVTTAGLNKLLDATFKTGLAEPLWYVGLVDGGSEPAYSADDTMASHAGWAENNAYTEGVRQTFTPGTIAVGAVDNSDSRAVFTISSDGAIAGCFLVDDDVENGEECTLYGEGAFTGGPRPVEIGDTLRVTTTVSVKD
jgi:hypothetical protein